MTHLHHHEYVSQAFPGQVVEVVRRETGGLRVQRSGLKGGPVPNGSYRQLAADEKIFLGGNFGKNEIGSVEEARRSLASGAALLIGWRSIT
jgi:hypothetical protein